MKMPALPAAILAAGLSLFPQAVTSAAGAADVVARVGGANISIEDVRAHLETLPPAERAAATRDPRVLSQVVRTYLARRIVLREAREKKFGEQPEVRAKLDQVRDAALAEIYLQSVTQVPDGVPSEADIRAAYDAQKSAFLLPRRYHLAQIYVAAPKGDAAAEKKARTKLNRVARELRSRRTDFAAIAREHSDNAAEAAQGGEIGWVPESRIVPQIREAAAGLKKGEVSTPLRLDDGWHIVRLLDTKPAGIRPLAEVREMLVQQLRQKWIQTARQKYLAALLQRYPAAINELALSKLATKAGK